MESKQKPEPSATTGRPTPFETSVRKLLTAKIRGRTYASTPVSLNTLERVQLESRAVISGYGKTQLIRYALAVCEKNGWKDIPQVQAALKARKMLTSGGQLVSDIRDRDFTVLRFTAIGRELVLSESRSGLDGEPVIR